MRKLAILCGGFALGVGLGLWLVPKLWLLPVAVVCFGLSMAITPWTSPWRRAAVLGLCGIAMALGHQWLYQTLWVEPSEQVVGQVLYDTVMTVEDYPTAQNYGARVEVSLTLPTGQSVRSMYYGDEGLLALTPKSTITNTVIVQSATAIDDEAITTFISRGIFLLLYSRGEAAYTLAEEGGFSPLVLGQRIKELIAQCFQAPYDGVVTAIITGDKSGLTQGISTDLSQAGLYHILAVSGMHCGFLLAMVLWMVGRQRIRLGALVGIPVLICFAMLVGGSPSVVRACSMVVMLLLAPVCRRQGDSITALAVALALILLQNPYALHSASLQLSFGAVAGIVWVSPKVYALLVQGEKTYKIWKFIALNLSVSVGAMAFTAPISFWYFGTFWLVSPLSNLLCVAVAGWVFITGVITLIGGAIYLPLGVLLAHIPTICIQYILKVCGFLGRLPYHAIYDVNPYFYPWLLLSYGLFVIAWRWGKGSRSFYLATSMALISLVAIVLAGRWSLTCATVDGFAVDIGQGQCVVLESNGQTAMVDCGSGNTWVSAGDRGADVLQTMGCYRLEHLVLTHYDKDHCNGVETLLRRMAVGTLYVPNLEMDNPLGANLLQAAALAGTKIVTVTEPLNMAFGAGMLTIYPPVSEASSNDSGISVHCKAGTWDALITGDLGGSAEVALAEVYPLEQVDVWMVGHHGSDTSSHADFLQAITPKNAIISVGDNSYGHPTVEVLQRLQQAGAMVYRTDLQGTIHFSAN